MSKYTNPHTHDYLMEAEACKKIERDLHRLINKYRRAVEKEEAARKKALETALGYHSEREIQDDYGWEVISEEQYALYLKIFREGEAALKRHEKSVNELALSVLTRIQSDIAEDQFEWELSALSPEEQTRERKRANENKRAWKNRIAELKRELGIA